MKRFWNKLFARKEVEPEPQPSPGCLWLEPGPDNPFGVRVLDVRPLTQTVVSTTKDQSIAARFVELRGSDGSEFPGADLESVHSVSCDLRVPFPHEIVDGPLFKAAAMEEKWDIYSHGSVLYFARSWTGDLVYRAPCELIDGSLQIRSIDSVWQHDPKADQAVLFLLVSHVLGRPFPNPVHDPMPADPEHAALASCSAFGNRAWYATASDVTQIPIPAGNEPPA